jgi:hypothetical protein
MAHSDDLIAHATFLADLNFPNDPKQVDLRRAVSAAYYALFHLPTSEAARNWKHDRHQTRLARIFDHKTMKARSSRAASEQGPADPAKRAVFAKLKVVAENFVSLQQVRHDADYDNARVWSRTQAYGTRVFIRSLYTIFWIPALMGYRAAAVPRGRAISSFSPQERIVAIVTCAARGSSLLPKAATGQ